jgi:hypothetical protein
MMDLTSYFLADADALKLIFGIVVAIVWGLGALASAAKKKQKDAEAQRQHQEHWQRIGQEMRDRAAKAVSTLSQQPGQAPPPPLPPRASVHAPPRAPQPVFAPQRSIAGRPVAQRPMPPRAVPARPVTQTAPRRPKKQKAKAQGLPTAPPLPAAAAAPVAVQAASPAAASATAGERRGGTAANAAALSRWLTPATLRSQFILTEILQPPLALRPPADEPGGSMH